MELRDWNILQARFSQHPDATELLLFVLREGNLQTSAIQQILS